MDSARRKELINAYKEKPADGGIYCIQCDGNHRMLIRATKNLAGQQNKFTFAISTKSCPEPTMRAEWEKYGLASFSFLILDRLTKKELQTELEFSEDLDALLKMWLEKYGQDDSR